MKPSDPDAAKLLRGYPRGWRERYGEEFLAMVEDSLDGERPGLGVPPERRPGRSARTRPPGQAGWPAGGSARAARSDLDKVDVLPGRVGRH